MTIVTRFMFNLSGVSFLLDYSIGLFQKNAHRNDRPCAQTFGKYKCICVCIWTYVQIQYLYFIISTCAQIWDYVLFRVFSFMDYIIKWYRNGNFFYIKVIKMLARLPYSIF